MPDMSMQPQSQPPMPMNDPMGGGMPPMDDPMGGENQDMGGGMPPMDDPMGGGNQDMGGNNNQFDSNFDAGVQADEDEDPENYIKQLTGKLSQKLRSFNGENGEPDESLNKYVAKMVIKAAADGMSPEGRTELKKAVNTAKGSDDESEDMSSDGNNETDGMDGENGEDMQSQMMECRFTKKTLEEALTNLSSAIDKKEPKNEKKPKKLKPSIYSGYKNTK